jgi:hypothetical protein
MLHFSRHVGKLQLFRFSSFVLVRLVDSSSYRRKKRVAARRGVHIAGQRFTERNILAVERNRGVVVLLELSAIHGDSDK